MTVSVIIDVVDENIPAAERKQMLQEAAQLVVDRAKISAPYDTGELVRSIDVDSVGAFTAVVSASAEHAIYQEEGTSRGIQAQNFMEDAMNTTERDFNGKLVFTKELKG
jgi:HK97 gp10 family phage protein